MDFDIERIAPKEYEELYHRYAPLAAAVRELMEASLHTAADAATVRSATAAIEAVTEALNREQRIRTGWAMRHQDTGRPVVWSNPAVGVRNPIAPPMLVHHEPDGRGWSEFTLGGVYEGPPGLVHGGVCALLLDQLLGEVATRELTEPRFTGTITLRYLRGTPLGRLRAEAHIDRVEGHKTYARGFIGDNDGPTVEAEGVFIMPAWARDNQ
ncbi:MAG: PaaI family thioesterase [Mycobacterium sp.]